MAKGFNLKRMGIALFLAALCGLFCAYGTANVQIPGLEITMALLLTIFYSRLLIGFVIGLSENVKLLKNENLNPVVRGGLMGAIVSVGVSFYDDGGVMIAFGIVYGIVTDFIATKLSS